jgi:hypothetical protein
MLGAGGGLHSSYTMQHSPVPCWGPSCNTLLRPALLLLRPTHAHPVATFPSSSAPPPLPRLLPPPQDPAARLAWWSLQQRLHRADKAAQRAYAEAALACALLGLQLMALGGPDVVQLRLEVLDQDAYCRWVVCSVRSYRLAAVGVRVG